MAEWTLDLPPLPYVSPNKRGHWTARSRHNRAWRHAAKVLAIKAGIPPCARISVALTYTPPDRRRRDPDNLVSGVLKPVVDGLVDARVIVDDTADQVVREFPTITDPADDRRPRWTLHVVDLGGNAR